MRTPLTAVNTFRMPGLMEPGQAAHALIRGLERRRFGIRFSRRFTGILKFTARLPYRLYFRLVQKMVES